MAFFASVTALVFRYLPQYGRSNVWAFDALSQHFPALYYFNVWARGMIAHPSLGVPLWSWNLGLGADVIPTLAFYAFGDPFSLLSLAFPMHAMEYAYEALFFARILVAALGAWLYFRKMGARAFGATAGALIYVFTAFTLIAAMRHPFFVTGMVFFPLVLLGIERALRNRSSWLLVLSVALAAIGNFYFFYMIAIVSLIYAIARYFELSPKETRWSGLIPSAIKIGVPYLLGVMLAAPLLFPVAHGVLDSWRGEEHYVQTLFYSLGAYRLQLYSITTAFGSQMGVAFLAILLVPVALMRAAKRPALAFMIVLLAAFLAFPFFGSVLNGLTFPDNRFAFMWPLFLGLNVALVLSDDRPLSRAELGATFGFAVAFCGLVYATHHPLPTRALAPMALGGVTWILFAFESLTHVEGRALGPHSLLDGEWRASLSRWAVLAVLVVNVAASAAFVYDRRGDDYLTQFVKQGTVLSEFESNPGALAKKYSEADPAYRVQNDHQLGFGDALVQGYHGTSFYWSLLDGLLTRFRIENQAAGDNGLSFRYKGFDDRAALTALVGVKYVIATSKETGFVPPGFSAIEHSGDATVYSNPAALPLGFVYDSVIPRATYDALPPLQKQQVLLQGAVVDGPVSLPVASITPTVASAIDVAYSVAATTGATFQVGAKRIVKTAHLSVVSLSVTPPPGAEIYLTMRGIKNTFASVIKPGNLMTTYSAGGSVKHEKWTTPTNSYYYGMKDQTVNLGSRTAKVHHIKLWLHKIGTLSFSDFKVQALPITAYPAQINALRSHAMRDITLGTNRVSGTVSSPANGVLFLSIPYTTGWTATVDGHAAPTFPVDTAFTGIAVTSGTHAVVLRYMTPWLPEGLAVAAFAVFLLLVLWCAVHWQRRRSRGSTTVTE